MKAIPDQSIDWGRYVRPALTTVPTLMTLGWKWNPLVLSALLYVGTQFQGGDRRRVAHWGNLLMLSTSLLRSSLFETRFTPFGILGDGAGLGIAGALALIGSPNTTQEGPSLLWRPKSSVLG